MRIVIGNLPDDITEDGVREALGQFAPVDRVKLLDGSRASTAVIEMELTHARAQLLARRIQGRIYKGRALNAWVPLPGWN